MEQGDDLYKMLNPIFCGKNIRSQLLVKWGFIIIEPKGVFVGTQQSKKNIYLHTLTPLSSYPLPSPTITPSTCPESSPPPPHLHPKLLEQVSTHFRQNKHLRTTCIYWKSPISVLDIQAKI